MNRTPTQKTDKETADLNTRDQMDLTDIYITFVKCFIFID